MKEMNTSLSKLYMCSLVRRVDPSWTLLSGMFSVALSYDDQPSDQHNKIT